jgi:PKD repeat protein
MAAFTLVGAGCGDDNGGNPPANVAPVAAFTFACDALECTFTDGSTDPDGNDDIESWSWEFGTDGTSDEQSPVKTFSAAGTYQVTLTVTDAAGATNTSAAQPVTVSTDPGPVNAPPVADFDFICNAQDCTFTDASTDADGTVASWAWDFGDGNTSTEQSPVHNYVVTELTTFDVDLTVTDDDGAASTVKTLQVAVAPPAGTVCEDSPGEFVPCTLDIVDDAVVTVTITSADCTAEGNNLLITSPIEATVFENGCSEPVGPPGYVLNGGTAFTAGTPLEVQMISGSNDPERIAPAIRVTGTYPDWVLEFDDGEDPTGPGEPDFNDIVLAVHAEATP